MFSGTITTQRISSTTISCSMRVQRMFVDYLSNEVKWACGGPSVCAIYSPRRSCCCCPKPLVAHRPCRLFGPFLLSMLSDKAAQRSSCKLDPSFGDRRRRSTRSKATPPEDSASAGRCGCGGDRERQWVRQRHDRQPPPW